jgi:Fic family protein
MASDDELASRYPHIPFARNWEIGTQATYLLGRCDAIVDAISSLPLQPARRDQLLRVSLIKGAQATTAIEGNTLTEAEVEKVARGDSLPPSKHYQQREVRNILDAMNGLLDTVAGQGDTALVSDELLKTLHMAVGRDLGDQFDAIPGRYREDERVVGPYKCPRPDHVPRLVSRLCEWLPKEFGFASGRQTFADAVVQAIVAHVYVEWIHPFGDGNGRTGRLLEFYILLRAGNPDIASHILSNFYNETRPEYYRQLDRANKNRDLSAFISYAVQGYHDGLTASLGTIQDSLFEVAWKFLVHSQFAEHRYRKKTVFKRRRDLVLNMPPTPLSPEKLTVLSGELARQYASLSPRTLLRDLDVLREMKLIVKVDGEYRPNTGLLASHLARRRIHGAAAVVAS